MSLIFRQFPAVTKGKGSAPLAFPLYSGKLLHWVCQGWTPRFSLSNSPTEYTFPGYEYTWICFSTPYPARDFLSSSTRGLEQFRRIAHTSDPGLLNLNRTLLGFRKTLPKSLRFCGGSLSLYPSRLLYWGQMGRGVECFLHIIVSLDPHSYRLLDRILLFYSSD